MTTRERSLAVRALVRLSEGDRYQPLTWKEMVTLARRQRDGDPLNADEQRRYDARMAEIREWNKQREREYARASDAQQAIGNTAD